MFSAYYRYGKNPNMIDIFKSIAIFLMVIDHIGYFFIDGDGWLRAIGRASAPIWFFLLGYNHSKKIGGDIVALAILMIVADFLSGRNILPPNILITMIIYRLMLGILFEYKGNKTAHFADYAALLGWFILMFFSMDITAHSINYGMMGFFFALAGYFHAQNAKNELKTLVFTIAYIFFAILSLIMFGFDDKQSIFVLAILMMVTIAMSFFHQREFSNLPNILSIPLKIFGRFSLYFYFFHWIIFCLIVNILSDI